MPPGIKLSRDSLELFRWNLCIRAMQGPLGEMTKVRDIGAIVIYDSLTQQLGRVPLAWHHKRV